MGVGTAVLACLLASLPGPPGFMYHEAYIQTFPVSRANKMCDVISPKLDVRFLLYTSWNKGRTEVLQIGNHALLERSSFHYRRPTVLYLHGFLEGGVALSSNLVREAYLKRGDHNILIVDYRRLAAGPWYGTAVSNSGPVGRYVARFVDYLVSRGMSLDSLHVVGLSLGAHVAGVVGRNVQSGRLIRITGLDPAGPNFDSLPTKRRLDKSCAEFVDVIHTDGRVFGNIRHPVGHADFYPNGGTGPQPGCTLDAVIQRHGTPIEKVFCSHWRAFQYYSESVITDTAFPAVPCSSWSDFTKRRCVDSSPVYMGLTTTNSSSGSFFLRTRRSSPYSVEATRTRRS